MSKEYLYLLKMRKFFILGMFFGIPILLLCLFQILGYFNFSISFITLFLIITVLMIMLFGNLFFLSKDVCPWCKESFFNQDGHIDGISLIFRKNCQHCGMPNKAKNH
jgi:hypothetical protein